MRLTGSSGNHSSCRVHLGYPGGHRGNNLRLVHGGEREYWLGVWNHQALRSHNLQGGGEENEEVLKYSIYFHSQTTIHHIENF